jgi:hypothetical protein
LESIFSDETLSADKLTQKYTDWKSSNVVDKRPKFDEGGVDLGIGDDTIDKRCIEHTKHQPLQTLATIAE